MEDERTITMNAKGEGRSKAEIREALEKLIREHSQGNCDEEAFWSGVRRCADEVREAI